MTRRFLVGPVNADFADQDLYALRAAGRCLTFSHRGGADLNITHHETWESLTARLPNGWRPDFLALNLAYQSIPPALWSAPVPLVALAADWNFTFHSLRRLLPFCDVVFTDAPGVEVLRAHGYERALSAYLFGLQRAFLEALPAEGEKDLDVLFVANLHPAVQRERLAWLGRLANLADRWRILIATNVRGDDYRALLRRSRIAFNRSVRGECNRRVFEAAASGALLFQETGNAEVAALFRDRQECVFYTDDNLEALLEHYLTHEDERRTIAEAGQQLALSRPCVFFWEQMLAQIDERWDALQAQVACRPALQGTETLLARTEQALSSETQADLLLTAELAAAATQQPGDARLHNALGVVSAALGQTKGVVTAPLADKAAAHFRQALEADPANPLFALNLIEAFVGIDKRDNASDGAQRTLALLDRHPSCTVAQLDAAHFPPGFDLFRVEWEQAAWSNAGRPRQEVRDKVALLRWRLHSLVAELTGKLGHYYEAVAARPDLPTSRAALGCALAQAGHAATGVAHLRLAAEANPFDRAAARACCQALTDSGDLVAARRLARDQRLLRQAAPQLIPADSWFVDAPPVGDELVSLIVLCCNEVDFTRRCLESVFQHTRRPFELILVDNGSTDGTPAYLEEVGTRPGPQRVEVIRNAANQGFPAGCNQGLRQARGRYVVFLNNDTIVTEDWLDGLIAWALHDWPQVGLVGPVTNYAAPPQQIPVEYQRVDGIDAFAARRRREFAGKAREFERLSGFCLLARHEVLDQVGGFDERFGLGFFDDDDLGLRVRQAGFKLLIAQNVFVHHFGSRTFAGLGIDCVQQLRDNLEQFKTKWGPEAAAPYRLPDGSKPTPLVPMPSAGSPATPRVSLCLIVKNEEKNLPACLESAADLVDEIVVVDTGSTDQTKTIAARFGAKVVDFPWIDSFSAARNESLRHATGQWIFWMDADDRLDADNRDKLRSLFATLRPENAAYSMKCLCLPDADTGTATVVDHIRLFRNDPTLRWEHRVHEQILPAIRRLGAEVRWADVVVHHAGYQDSALRKKKLGRDLRLLELERAELGDHPFTLFNLGSVFQELGQHADALTVLRRSLELSHPSDSIVRKLYALIVSCHRTQGQLAEALTACQEGRRVYPDDAELLFAEALLRRDQQDLDGAAACLQQLLASKPGAHFASVDAGLRGYKARQNLGVIYRQQGKLAEAEREWQTVVAERADFLPAWLALGELYLTQQRWPELEEAARRMEVRPQGRMEAAVLRARAELAQRHFPAARQRLEQMIHEHSQALWPRVILSHVLLQEDRDLAAAEQALRDILALDPNHVEARNNLAVLLRQRQQRAADTLFTNEQLRTDSQAEIVHSEVTVMPMPAQVLDDARALLGAGQFLAAEQLCRQALAADGGCADAWSLLGEIRNGQGRAADAVEAFRRAVGLQPRQPMRLLRLATALAEVGRLEEAATALREAIEVQPDLADGHYQLGVVQARLGQTDQAAASYRAAVRYRPQHAEALTNLGVTLAQQGHLPEAIDTLRRAIAGRPTFAKAHHNLGVALAEQGHLAEAANSLRKALQHQPDYAEAHFNLANTLRDLGQRAQALASFYEALYFRPDYPDALNNLGLLLTETSRPAEAVILLRQALRLRPDFTEACNNLGLALADLGRFDEAIACYEQVLAQNPRSTDAHTNLGSAYKEQGRLEEAIACYDQALRLKPDAASTHWNRALAWLQQGDFERGWAEYEWRWKRKNARPRPFRQPLWDGTPLQGRTILLWSEQGLGDTIQFVRYASVVHDRGGRVLLECPPPLRNLFQSVSGVERLLTEGEPLPPLDVHAPLMSLPYLCQTTLASIPATVPYLHADAQRVERWRARLPAGRFRIGVVWQGNPHHKWDRHRSFPVHALAPLATVPRVQLVCLQKGAGLEALSTNSPCFPLTQVDDRDQNGSFVDTAAVMTHLDLVVTADTAPAHLAGALGVPVWVALAAITDWRWLRDRDDTPWYPSMRLFRQRTLGDWDNVFTRMAQAVVRLTERRDEQAILTPITPGELIDKLTILAIKRDRITDPDKRAHVEAEWAALMAVRTRIADTPEVAELTAALRVVNETLWQVEDDIRRCERDRDFGSRFIELARAIYRHNDERSRLKACLNRVLGSPFSEQKAYAEYHDGAEPS